MEEIFIYDVFAGDDEDPLLGTDKISLVGSPAIMIDFIAMSETEEIYKKIALSEDEKRIVTGPALIPDIEIIRKDEEGNPYFIRYSEQQIEKIAQKFFKHKDQYSVNKDHKEDVGGIYIYESWLTAENDKSKQLGFNLPKGTWMLSLKIDDDKMWQKIKSGEYKGFSIEGFFRFKKAEVKQEAIELERGPWVERFLRKYTDSELVLIFDTLERLRRQVKLEKLEQTQQIENNKIKMTSTILKNGTTIYTDAETFDVGVEVYLLDGETKSTPEAGEHELEDGTIVITDEAGIITEIKPFEETPAEEAPVEEVAQEDYMIYEHFEALKGMLENISLKLDTLMGTKMPEVEQSLVTLSAKLEAISLEKEVKSAEVTDKKVSLSAINKKPRPDYNTITRFNKKF